MTVGNQPTFAFDANGNLRVATVGGGAGRSAAVLLNVAATIPSSPPATSGFFASSDVSVGQFTELSLDASAGVSCTIRIAVQRKAAFGDYFTVDQVDFTGSASESIGAGASKNVTFGSTIRIVASVPRCVYPGTATLNISLIGK